MSTAILIGWILVACAFAQAVTDQEWVIVAALGFLVVKELIKPRQR